MKVDPQAIMRAAGRLKRIEDDLNGIVEDLGLTSGDASWMPMLSMAKDLGVLEASLDGYIVPGFSKVVRLLRKNPPPYLPISPVLSSGRGKSVRSSSPSTPKNGCNRRSSCRKSATEEAEAFHHRERGGRGTMSQPTRNRSRKTHRSRQKAKTDSARNRFGTNLRKLSGHERGIQGREIRDIRPLKQAGMLGGAKCTQLISADRDALNRAMLSGSLSVSALLRHIDKLLQYVRRSTSARRLCPLIANRIRSQVSDLRLGLQLIRHGSNATTECTCGCSHRKLATSARKISTTESEEGGR